VLPNPIQTHYGKIEYKARINMVWKNDNFFFSNYYDNPIFEKTIPITGCLFDQKYVDYFSNLNSNFYNEKKFLLSSGKMVYFINNNYYFK
jgi:hypothetical protein